MFGWFWKLPYYIVLVVPFVLFSFLPAINGKCGALTCLYVFLFIVVADMALVKLFLKKARSKLPQEPVEFSEVEIADGEVITAVLTYLVPLLTFFLDKENFALQIVIGVILCANLLPCLLRSVIPSPFLLFVGYHCYKASIRNGVGGCLLITKKMIRNPKEVKSAIHIFAYVYLE